MRFVKESVIAASAEAVFAFHEAPDAFARLQPPWQKSEVITPPRSLAVGTRVVLRTRSVRSGRPSKPSTSPTSPGRCLPTA